MTLENEYLSSPKSRASRIKEARDIAGLTLKETASTGLINFNTLCGWETAKHGGLTERGAILISKRLSECSIDCSIEWLLYGQGNKPKKQVTTVNAQPNDYTNRWTESLHRLIINSHPNLLHIQITDLSMMPEYNIGDYVYGYPISSEMHPLSAISGRTVLVQQQSNSLILRKLTVNQISNEILLTASNHDFHPPFLYNPTIQTIAIISCHLKNDGIII